jgi:prephenate dehydratase
MSEKRSEPIKPPQIPVRPLKGLIVVDVIIVLSNYEKDAEKKKVKLTVDQIVAYNKGLIESTKDATQVWTEHPDQAVIVSITDEDAENYKLRVGDHIAYNHSEHTGFLLIFKKKRYMALRPQEIIFRYLTEEV